MAALGEQVDIEIVDLGRDGRGIGRIDGQVVFVDGGLPGEQVRIRLTGRARGHLLARMDSLLTPSAARRRSPCILADHCGGCSLQALEDGAEGEWKQTHVREALRRIAGLDPPEQPLLASESALGYRNRAVIPLERGEAGRLRAGFYRRGTHRIVNMNHCPVLDPRLDALIVPLKADLEATGWPVNREAEPGSPPGLRHLGLRVGHHTGELLICLIASHDALNGLEELAAGWMERWSDLVGVCLNLQPEPTNLLMGSQTRTIAGRGWLMEHFAGLRYRIAADTFFQVNTLQAERVVELLHEALGPLPGQLVDAYCGIGTYSLPLAAAGWQVHGIEQHPAAVSLACVNAAENGLTERTSFEVASVGSVLAERLAPPQWFVQALFLDPPRKGLDPPTLAAIEAQPPPLVAYLSCDPATLARDLGRLCGSGTNAGSSSGPYRLRSLQPLDFFPNTTHVEALAVLEHR
jgi:23S rRNA (uracil1939-C5)-methyltransferase